MDVAIGFLLGCSFGIFIGFAICALATLNGKKEAHKIIKRLEDNSNEQ